MRRLLSVLCTAGLLFSLIGAAHAASAQAGDPVGAPYPAPAGAHWRHVLPDRGEAQGSPEVVGGTPASPGAFPYQVALVDPHVPGLPIRGQFCGGSLISPDTVLTASHCVVLGVWVLLGPDDQIIDVDVEMVRPSDVDVMAGDIDLGRDSLAERLHVRQIRVDPDFTLDFDAGFNFFVPDVAILQLKTPSTTGVPVDLATPADAALYPAGTPATVTGWGSTGDALEAPPTVMQQGTMPIVSDADCEVAYGSDVDSTLNICAGDLADGLPTPCFGDSGGPLVIDNGGDPLQVGIVLGGDGCPSPERPAIYSRVAHNIDFVGRYLDPDEVPDKPRRVTAQQHNDTVHVTWRSPEFDGGTPITGYKVKVVSGPAVAVGRQARALDVDIIDRAPFRTYRVTVRAVNAVGTGAPQVRSFTMVPVVLP